MGSRRQSESSCSLGGQLVTSAGEPRLLIGRPKIQYLSLSPSNRAELGRACFVFSANVISVSEPALPSAPRARSLANPIKLAARQPGARRASWTCRQRRRGEACGQPVQLSGPPALIAAPASKHALCSPPLLVPNWNWLQWAGQLACRGSSSRMPPAARRSQPPSIISSAHLAKEERKRLWFGRRRRQRSQLIPLKVPDPLGPSRLLGRR